MAQDNIYIWDKIGSQGTRTLLGEAQCGKNGYNMGFSIDGSKDTAKMEVLSFSIENPVKPYTIVWHENTDTYWIVNKDKVEKYVNERGSLYKHSLTLDGAVELLNARDLTDCGFYQNLYTIDDFIRRLLDLSTFEFGGSANVTIDYGIALDGGKTVDYVKSFENYTLLSALREFLDGYNSVAKLRFNQNVTGQLNSCLLKIVSKTGDTATEALDMGNAFLDVKELRDLSKNSYGNLVVSNADNVISTKSKVYPNVGYARLSSDEFYIKPENAVFRLPSKANSVEWVEMSASTMKIGIAITYGPSATDKYTFDVDLSDIDSYKEGIEWVRHTLTTKPEDVSQEIWDNLQAYMNSHFDEAFWANLSSDETRAKALDENSFRFYDTTEYDPIANTFKSERTINRFRSFNVSHGWDKPWVLGNKAIRDGVQEPQSVMYWERGSDLIKGFDFFDFQKEIPFGAEISSITTHGYRLFQFEWTPEGEGSGMVDVYISSKATLGIGGALFVPDNIVLSVLNANLRVKYTPMTDLKIKYDNTNYGNDSKLYNQNGRYTDGVALSKLLLSYKDEITSDTVTRYAEGYDMNDMPKVGQIVTRGNDRYVIGNASFDFFQHEEGNGNANYIIGEYTLSKNVAVKSALTNPNTNIRDYGIPQQFNVRRKQLYRDFYELSFSSDPNADASRYLDFGKVMNVTHLPSSIESHTALIKCQYEEACGGGGTSYGGGVVPSSTEWCFQVDSTVYYLKKALYEVIDLKDNNIIGYDSQNITCGFDIRRLFEMIDVGSADIDAVNTPISYVDGKGKVLGFTLSVLDNAHLKSVWNDYKTAKETQYGETYRGSLYNRCVFIPTELFDMSVLEADYLITDFSYRKDPIEVPVFEYSCQVDDTDDVLVGDEILTRRDDDFLYFHEAVRVPKGVVTNNNWRLFFSKSDIVRVGNALSINDGSGADKKTALLWYGSNLLQIDLFNSCSVNTENMGKTNASNINAHEWVEDGYDLMIVRYSVPKDVEYSGANVSNDTQDLMLVIRNAEECPHQGAHLILSVNHYKLR